MRKNRVEEDIAPNLIPMVDIMFLLLLFFMLGSDMGQRELEDVKLPKADMSSPDKREDRLTVNVHHDPQSRCGSGVCRDERHWRIGIRGVDVTKADALDAALAREAGPGDLSDRRVMIRADRTAPYGLPQRVMNACAKAKIFKVEVGAATQLQNP